MKTNAIIRIILYSLVILILTALLCTFLGIGFLSFDLSAGTDSYITGEAAVDADGIRNLEIDWAAGSVTIVTGDVAQITFSENRPDNEAYTMAYKQSGSTLKLSYSDSTISIGFGNFNIPEKDLIVTVPRDWACTNLEIDGAALDITIEDLHLQTLDLDGASCSLRFFGSVDNVEIDGASADIDLQCTDPVSDINVDGASCDLELTLPEDCGFWVQMDGLSCAFRSDLDYSTGDGSYFRGDRHCRINVDGLSCDVYIRKGE